jgi:hypothetical protein
MRNYKSGIRTIRNSSYLIWKHDDLFLQIFLYDFSLMQALLNHIYF